jgi:hypothetical protein
MDDAGHAAVGTWTIWGLALAVLGLANLAVMGFDPVPRQHAVVGFGAPVVTLVAALATQTLWRNAPRWTWLAAWLAAITLFFAGSALQTVLGEAFLYGLGGAGRAAEEAPLALLGTVWAAGLTVAMRRVAWLPGAVATVFLLGLYVWASSWEFGGAAEGAALFGGAVLNGTIAIAFAAAGWGTALATRSRNPG